MRRKMLNFRVYLVLFSVSVLWLLANRAMAEGDGAWITTASPGYTFLIEESMFNNEMYMSMTVLKPGYIGGESYWGPASASKASTYLLRPLNEESDMTATWQFNSVTQATVTVESCTTNCLWQPGQVVTLNKFFGDMRADPEIASRVPKTGQTQCWDIDGNPIDCKGTGQDGEYQLGVLPIYPPSILKPYTVHHWTGTRFTDNGNGTVTDNLTGLIWLANANCFGFTNWNQALSNCNNLASGSCGLTDGSSAGDWRLPNINELRSLINPDTSHPALPQGYATYFTNVPTSTPADYWTSTTHKFIRNPLNPLAYIVRLDRGNVAVMFKFVIGELHPVATWPCRSGI